MTEFRIEEGNFTILPNEIFRYEGKDGKRLKPEVIGLYALMLSLPPSWDYTIQGLTKVVNAGTNKINNLLKELELAGFIKRERLRDDNGKFGKVIYTVLRKRNEEAPYRQNPHVDKPYVDNPYVENDQQVSTKEVSTNVVSTKRDIVENVITYLNQVAGTNFRANTKSTIGFINGRINNGYTLQDFKNVIDVKSKEWLNTDMQKYLRPATLFNPTKFEAYVNETSNKHNQIAGKLEDHMLELNKGGDLF